MIKDRSLLLLVFMVCLPLGTSCGKKGPPTLPVREHSAQVHNLVGKAEQSVIVLEGKITGGQQRSGITGARVYHGQYAIEEPPCAGCPVEYHGYQVFGPEVITEGRFSCRLTMPKGKLYVLRVRLIGSSGAIGPPSQRVTVAVK